MVKKSAKIDAVVNPSYYLGPELYPRIARRQQRAAPFSDSRGGRPCLDLLYDVIFNYYTYNIFGSLENALKGGVYY